MAEYIEREALIAEIAKAQVSLESNNDVIWELNEKYFAGLAWARRLALDAPVADVAPVVHGRWDGEKDHGEFREVKCTACGGILLVKWSTRLSEYCYCPNCGARMDGE